MTYYKDYKFDFEYIRIYKKTILNLWNNKYKSNKNQESNESTSKQSALSAHMFKKRKIINTDELESYLKEPASINFDVDILTYWKVKFYIILYL